MYRGRALALGILCAVTLAGIASQMRATAVRARETKAEEAALIPLMLPTQPPKGAITLFTGKAEQIGEHWYQRYSKQPARWTAGNDGAMLPKNGDITSKAEFGDCYLHVEFRTPVDAQGKRIGHGNSGIGLQGRYEVQILDSYGERLEPGGCGAFYSQKPAKVNACKKSGEWQSFDIIFRAPRFDANGQVVEKPRATVFQNGILIHNNEEFLDMTGIQYGEYKTMSKTGPIVLQGDHDPVQFRNIWVVPM
jgi:hypothetical protein